MSVSFDAFICHAESDKEQVARPLVQALKDRGFKVWFDEEALKPGASLRCAIDEGLALARHAIVIISPSFFGRGWTEWELSGIVQRHLNGDYPFLIPVWHKINSAEVRRRSPSLADVVPIRSGLDLDEMADRVADLLRASVADPPSSDFAADDIEVLVAADAWAASGTAVRALLESICAKLSVSVGLPRTIVHGAVWLSAFDGAGQLLIPIAQTMDAPFQRRLRPGESVSGRVVQTARPYVVSDVEALWQPAYKTTWLDTLSIKSMASIPLRAPQQGGEPRVFAVLNVYSTKPTSFGTASMHLLNETSGWFGCALHDLLVGALQRAGRP